MATDDVAKNDIGWKHALKKWTYRAFVGLPCVLGVACLAGASYELVGERRDSRRFPVQGQLVDAGGMRLNINCTGHGGIPVILENGMGIPGAGWSQVQSEVEKFTRVCSYDRAGYGWSDPGPLPRTSLQIAKELHTLLHNASELPPYIWRSL